MKNPWILVNHVWVNMDKIICIYKQDNKYWLSFGKGERLGVDEDEVSAIVSSQYFGGLTG